MLQSLELINSVETAAFSTTSVEKLEAPVGSQRFTRIGHLTSCYPRCRDSNRYALATKFTRQSGRIRSIFICKISEYFFFSWYRL